MTALLRWLRWSGRPVLARRRKPDPTAYRVDRLPKLLDGKRPPRWRWMFL